MPNEVERIQQIHISHLMQNHVALMPTPSVAQI